MCSKENCGSKTNFGLEKFWAKNILFPKKNLCQKFLGQKKFRQRKCWAQKSFGSKIVWLIWFNFGSKINLGPKNLGQKNVESLEL